MPTRLIEDILNAIAARGLFEGREAMRTLESESLVRLSQELLSTRGEASGVALGSAIVARYREEHIAERLAYLADLAEWFGPDAERLAQAIEAYQNAPSDCTAHDLHEAAEPRRQELIRRINMAPTGTRALLAMREDLLTALPDRPELGAVDADFRHLFSSWFNRGFLVLRRIDWQTPAAVLEKIIRYEAVHEIADWDDLRRRIDPPDRRLYAFFHPALGDEPLIFVEVALCEGTPGAIEPLLSPGEPTPSERTDTAVFYSISNCQPGLKGVSFGSFLIKQVAQDLAREFPGITDFVTLSPVPGFKLWLDKERDHNALAGESESLSKLEDPAWPSNAADAQELREILLPLAAQYFLAAKNTRGRPHDPVQRFHLGNGARLERINWLGNPGPRGLRESAGIMVNYRYVLKDIERNHEAYAVGREVIAAPAVRRLAERSKAEADPGDVSVARRRK